MRKTVTLRLISAKASAQVVLGRERGRRMPGQLLKLGFGLQGVSWRPQDLITESRPDEHMRVIGAGRRVEVTPEVVAEEPEQKGTDGKDDAEPVHRVARPRRRSVSGPYRHPPVVD